MVVIILHFSVESCFLCFTLWSTYRLGWHRIYMYTVIFRIFHIVKPLHIVKPWHELLCRPHGRRVSLPCGTSCIGYPSDNGSSSSSWLLRSRQSSLATQRTSVTFCMNISQSEHSDLPQLNFYTNHLLLPHLLHVPSLSLPQPFGTNSLLTLNLLLAFVLLSID